MSKPALELEQVAVRRLLAAAAAQERGDLRAIDEGYEELEARAAGVAATADLATVVRFWDGWIDARNHDWEYYDPLTEDDWPVLARQVAADLSSSSGISNALVLREFGPASQRARAVLRAPIRGCLRMASAAVGIIIGMTGMYALFSSTGNRPFGYFLLAWGALMWFPVFARPRRSRAAVAARERRVAIAMMVTLLLSMYAYGTSYMVGRGYLPVHDRVNVSRQINNPGASLWLVMFVLVFFVAYYHAQGSRPAEGDDDAERDGA